MVNIYVIFFLYELLFVPFRIMLKFSKQNTFNLIFLFVFIRNKCYNNFLVFLSIFLSQILVSFKSIFTYDPFYSFSSKSFCIFLRSFTDFKRKNVEFRHNTIIKSSNKFISIKFVFNNENASVFQ